MQSLDTLSLNAAAKVLGSTVLEKDEMFTGVNIDTRKLQTGELFVAIEGENFDGHNFLAQAQEKGAVGAVVKHKNAEVSLPQLQVSDTRLALGELAKARRNAFHGKVVGLTGSNGKTTVKELIAAILRSTGATLATEGNFNNDIGMPLTLLKIKNTEKYAVIEMGANHPGEIAYLTGISQPDVAVITNAGAAHLEGFKSIEGVAKAKGEIFSGVKQNGYAIVNADDKYANYWLSITSHLQVLKFSISTQTADVFAKNIADKAFDLCVSGKCVRINFLLFGKHNVANALAAAAVATALKIDLATIKHALENVAAVSGRLAFFENAQGVTVIDDCYNANLDSTLAAIDVLASLSGRKIMVFGDMLEGGKSSHEMHEKVGMQAKKSGVDFLFCIGTLAKGAAEAFGEGGKYFLEKSTLVSELSELVRNTDNVLIKASRGMHLEEVVNALKGSGAE